MHVNWLDCEKMMLHTRTAQFHESSAGPPWASKGLENLANRINNYPSKNHRDEQVTWQPFRDEHPNWIIKCLFFLFTFFLNVTACKSSHNRRKRNLVWLTVQCVRYRLWTTLINSKFLLLSTSNTLFSVLDKKIKPVCGNRADFHKLRLLKWHSAAI